MSTHLGKRYLQQVQKAFARRIRRERLIEAINITVCPLEVKRLRRQLAACVRLDENYPVNI